MKVTANTAKFLIGALVTAAVSGAGYYFFYYKPGYGITTKENAMEVIIKKYPSASIETMQSMDAGYLVARARAIRSEKESFEFDGKKYLTLNGRAI